jgi:lipoprotein-anchoring transpeptidase ErfK/SrfK
LIARVVIFGSICLFGSIAFLAWLKNSKKEPTARVTETVFVPEVKEEEQVVQAPETVPTEEVDRIDGLFATDSSKLPIVETITYTSRVPWMIGRPAWITDYASYYHTSRHFIARSLNKIPDYMKQDVKPGDRFNVITNEKPIEFHLVIDVSKSKMKFYYYDVEENTRVFLKKYDVGLGRKDSQKASGFLTPIGTYKLGEKVAVYRPGVMGYFKNQKIEMIQVFGTRWIPFEKEIENCSEQARGFGLHGSPWRLKRGDLVEDREHIGKYDSDGCVRLNSEDIEEIFAVVITKPTFIHIVPDFSQANLPGEEKAI